MYEDYHDYLKERLSPQRYYHSVCVAQKAVELAKTIGTNENKAYLAGLLHDISKELPLEEQLHYLKSNDIIVGVELLDNPFVLHGIVGSFFVRQEFGIDDNEILDAIHYHTTARANMSELERIIFLADYISIDREYPKVDGIRDLVEESWDKAMVACLSFGISQGIKNKTAFIKDSIDAYNFYLFRLRNCTRKE